jgi:hypothetical protein
VVICALRGVLSFGTSYAVQPFIDLGGYDGAFLIYGILTGALAAVGIPIYFFSPQILLTVRCAIQRDEADLLVRRNSLRACMKGCDGYLG